MQSAPLNYATTAPPAVHALTFRRILWFAACMGLFAGFVQAVRSWSTLGVVPSDAADPQTFMLIHSWWSNFDSAFLQVLFPIALGLLALRACLADRPSFKPLLVLAWIILALAFISALESALAILLTPTRNDYISYPALGVAARIHIAAFYALAPGGAAAAILLAHAARLRPAFPPRRLTLLVAVVTAVLYAGNIFEVLAYGSAYLFYIQMKPASAWLGDATFYTFASILVRIAAALLVAGGAIVAIFSDGFGRRLLVTVSCILIAVQLAASALDVAHLFSTPGSFFHPPYMPVLTGWELTTIFAGRVVGSIREIAPPALIVLLLCRPSSART